MRSHAPLRLNVTEECEAAVNPQFFVASVQMHCDSALAERQLVGPFLIAETACREVGGRAGSRQCGLPPILLLLAKSMQHWDAATPSSWVQSDA